MWYRVLRLHLTLCTAILTLPMVASGQGMTPYEALQTAQRTGKPVLAIATSPTCGPCLALKSTIHSEPRLKPLLSKFVLLEMERNSNDFARFQAKFPAEVTGVPMVYMLRADGEMIYGQSGAMNAQQLTLLLNQGITQSGRIFSPSELQRLELIFDGARKHAAEGNLTAALSVMTRIGGVNSFAEVVQRAREKRDELEGVLNGWIEELDRSLAAGRSIHANSYRLAELYVELPESATALRNNVRNLLVHYESQPRTTVAVQQNKRLIRARLEEQRDLCGDAVASYDHVINLSPATPAGEYAIQRLQVVRERYKLKLASVKSGGGNAVVSP